MGQSAVYLSGLVLASVLVGSHCTVLATNAFLVSFKTLAFLCPECRLSIRKFTFT